MTEIRFYHLQSSSQEQALPLLLGKILERGHRIVLKLRDRADLEKMNNHLWSFDPNSFLPHGSDKDGNANRQPIWLTDVDENPNNADVLVLCQGAVSDIQDNFDICCEIFDGNDDNAVAMARERWKFYKEQEFDVTYWKQNQAGGWD